MASWLIGVLLFAGMMVCFEIGHRSARRFAKREGADVDQGLTVVEGSVFTLLGLILAFSFSSAQSRFDIRRSTVIEEANCISTAYLRLDLLQEPARGQLQELFGEWVNSRLEFNRVLNVDGDVSSSIAKTSELQKRIWELADHALEDPSNASEQVLLVPALNEMFDVAATRRIQSQSSTPTLILALLIGLSLLSSILAGRAIAVRNWHNWPNRLIFSAVIAFTVYVVVDLDHPRSGLIRLDYVDQLLYELKDEWRLPPKT